VQAALVPEKNQAAIAMRSLYIATELNLHRGTSRQPELCSSQAEAALIFIMPWLWETPHQNNCETDFCLCSPFFNMYSGCQSLPEAVACHQPGAHLPH
jgi:hypothetical protein